MIGRESDKCPNILIAPMWIASHDRIDRMQIDAIHETYARSVPMHDEIVIAFFCLKFQRVSQSTTQVTSTRGEV